MALNEFPEDWRDQPCYLVSIPRPLVPYVGGLLRIAEQRGFWASNGDFERGYTAVTELEVCLMSTCLDVLLQKHDELYRLINTSVRGQAYTVVSENPLVVTPAISPSVDLTVLSQDSLMGRIDRLTQLIDNRIERCIGHFIRRPRSGNGITHQCARLATLGNNHARDVGRFEVPDVSISQFISSPW